jgi:hypothetical protein
MKSNPGDIWKFEIASRVNNNWLDFYWIFRNERTGEIIWGAKCNKGRPYLGYIEITAS